MKISEMCGNLIPYKPVNEINPQENEKNLFTVHWGKWVLIPFSKPLQIWEMLIR